ncbi:MAG: hypothetical protein NVSMB13_08630 [Mycobacteriales bacterium]
MTPDTSGAPVLRRSPWWAQAVGWAGVALHIPVGFLYLGSGLIAPGYALLPLWALWAGLLVLAVRLLLRRPLLTPLVPVVAVALWAVVMAIGSQLLGWRP